VYKFIAKYGLAAHLAILAVAPLFLFPFYGESVSRPVVMWLALVSALWVVIEPSVRKGETIRAARYRVLRCVQGDGVIWALLVLVAFTGLRACNQGIGMAYNVESHRWMVTQPAFPIFPGCVKGLGFQSFAAALAILVLVVGCRHAIGKSARMLFLLLVSALSGLAAVIAVAALRMSVPLACSAAESLVSHSYVGFAFALHMMVGAVALFAMFDQKWRWLLPLALLSVGATAMGAFVFAPPIVSLSLAAISFAIAGYGVFSLFRVGKVLDAYRMIALFGLALGAAALIIAFCVPESVVNPKTAVFDGGPWFGDGFFALRDLLSGVLLKSWVASPWVGTGIGSFMFDVQFGLVEAEWALVPQGVSDLANGWLLFLTERGIVGAVVALLPVAFLLGSLSVAFKKWVVIGDFPHPAVLLAPFMVAAAVVFGCVDCSFFRLDASMTLVSMLALSVKSFPRKRRG